MNFFCYLLICLTLSLSAAPCCAGDICCNDADKECSGNFADNHKSEESTNTCSPFMVCGSCSGFEVISVNLSLDTEPEIVNTPNTLYILSYLSNYNLEFWQPPKIC